MLNEQYAAIESDFQRYYGLNIAEVYTGRIEAFRAARLASQLPPDGAVGRSQPSRGCRVTDYLLLDLIDLLREGNWLTVAVNTKPGDRPKQPKPVPRPGAPTRAPKITGKQVQAFLERRQSGGVK